ncbi:hypothetical protein GH810_14515 [Acetobacterium paludosum]|uniref:Uncharacterized protein n=1 Tax=Acetobacterium paludosum TaxID=52693 RepID=A0A923HZL1_9FIRM|nr:hypothetical protein [Acetobacterium paludosum]MBC3889524.1 hypothetical protein [Acetobacterium paludosum]
MNDLETTLDKYMDDTYKEMEAITDNESLKMLRDMALGAILYCFKAGIIAESDKCTLIDKINLEYGIKWQYLLKEKALGSSH